MKKSKRITLTLTAIRKEADRQHFFCTVNDIESACEVLSQLCLKGSTLLDAHLRDEHGRTDLPTDIFDGQPFRRPMRRLQKQWQRILSRPVSHTVIHSTEVCTHARRLTALHQSRIEHAEVCISRLTEMQARAVHAPQGRAENTKMIGYYQRLIDSHVASVSRLQECQRLNLLRIERLNR